MLILEGLCPECLENVLLVHEVVEDEVYQDVWG